MISLRSCLGIPTASISIRQLAHEIGQEEPPISLRRVMALYAITRTYQNIGGLVEGPLGYKRSGLIGDENHLKVQYSGGDIGWSSADGSTTATIRYQTMISYEGFFCHEKQSDSLLYPANEPYFMISIFPKYIPSWATTYMTRTYEGVDSGEGTQDSIGIWRQVIPEDLVVLVVGMEHDEGNEEEFKAKVNAAVQQVGSALSEDALGQDFFQTPKWLDLTTGLLSEGVFRVFGMGDDLLGINALTLTYDHLVAIADPYTPQNATLSLTGHGANYDVYIKYSTEIIEHRVPVQ